MALHTSQTTRKPQAGRRGVQCRDERRGLQDGTHCKLVAQKQLQNSQQPRAPEKIKAVPKRCLPYSLVLHPPHAEGSQKAVEE